VHEFIFQRPSLILRSTGMTHNGFCYSVSSELLANRLKKGQKRP